MASFRKRRRDGKVQSWFRKSWNAETGKWDFDFGWRDEPDDAPERFMETRDPEREGMLLYTVEEFGDCNQGPMFPIGDFVKMLEASA